MPDSLPQVNYLNEYNGSINPEWEFNDKTPIKNTQIKKTHNK
jgi:hypothetical protein